MASLGFSWCKLDHALYRRANDDGFLVVGVYVDDLIITGTSSDIIHMFKQEMQTLFQMSDLGPLSYYLGIEVSQEKDRITVCQSSYAKKILETAGMSECNSLYSHGAQNETFQGY
jgi:hypothetical protein